MNRFGICFAIVGAAALLPGPGVMANDFLYMNRLWVQAFPHVLPAEAVPGVYKLPGDGLIEISADAFKDLASAATHVYLNDARADLGYCRSMNH